jgi:ribonuclease R
MAKAIYSSDNIGHYGLAFEYYSHFTSPIRRYADVLAHRILEQNLRQEWRTDKDHLEAQCKHISLQERKASESERESTKYYQTVFLEKHVGQVFEGFISGMIDRGVFVTLKDNRCEGMVGFDRMGEVFDLDESRLRAVNRRSGKVLKMGDRVQVRILHVDRENRQIEMVFE